MLPHACRTRIPRLITIGSVILVPIIIHVIFVRQLHVGSRSHDVIVGFLVRSGGAGVAAQLCRAGITKCLVNMARTAEHPEYLWTKDITVHLECTVPHSPCFPWGHYCCF